MIAGKRVTVLIQARVSSTRLPAKHFRRIGDKSVLEWILWRLSHISLLDQVVISTAKESQSPLYQQYRDLYRYDLYEHEGDVNDVAGRHMAAACKYLADYYLIVSGDCPLIDEELIRQLLHCTEQADFWSISGQWPSVHEGINLYSFAGMQHIEQQSHTPDQRENFAYQVSFPAEKVCVVPVPESYQGRPCRISVDNMADLRFMNNLYQQCLMLGLPFNISSAVELFRGQPWLLNTHAHVKQKAVGYRARRFLLLTVAGPQWGMGHLSRMIALAQELNETYHHGIHFLINQDAVARARLEQEGYGPDYTEYTDLTLTETLQQLRYDVLIVDHKGLHDQSDVLGSLRDKKIVFYDTLPQSGIGVAYLLQGEQPGLRDEQPFRDKILHGLGTVCLNKKLEFLINKKEPKTGLYLSFGQADPEGYFAPALALLKPRFPFIQAVSPAYGDVPENGNNPSVLLLSDQTNDPAIATAEYGVCAFGLTFYELLLAGARVIALARTPADRELLRVLVARNYCRSIESLAQLTDNKLYQFTVPEGLYTIYSQQRADVMAALMEKL